MEINDNFIKKDQVSQDSIEKPVKKLVRRGPATVSASALQICHWGWQSISGKAQAHDDLEPGELPDHQSPFDPRAMGMGIPES